MKKLSRHKKRALRERGADINLHPERRLLTLPECATELKCSRRFLEMEVDRGRLIATRLSNKLVRVRDRDWQSYLDRGATRKNCLTP